MSCDQDSIALAWMRELAELGPELADAKLAEIVGAMTTRELAALEHDWKFWSRPKQVMPEGVWRILLILAGRAFGKTRALSEAVIEEVRIGRARRVALISMTDDDVKKVMIEGQHSGILARSPPWFLPDWQSSKDGGKLTWPNGAIAYVFSGESPNRIRGEEFDLGWWDEPANCAKETQEAVMYNLRMALRGNDHARLIMSTTPQRGSKMILDLVARAAKKPGGAIRVVRGNTFDNAANLPIEYQRDLLNEYAGTRLGKQELEGEILDDFEGALWRHDWIKHADAKHLPTLIRKVVAVDPAISMRHGSDETGIVVAALGADGRIYVLEDASGKYTADAWPRKVTELYVTHACEMVVAETNRGGELVAKAIRDAREGTPVKEVHAEHQKATRADPVAALYERGLVSHVGRDLVGLEDQMLSWDPKKEKSPDRIDALVWACFELRGDVDVRAGFRNILETNAGINGWRDTPTPMRESETRHFDDDQAFDDAIG